MLVERFLTFRQYWSRWCPQRQSQATVPENQTKSIHDLYTLIWFLVPFFSSHTFLCVTSQYIVFPLCLLSLLITKTSINDKKGATQQGTDAQTDDVHSHFHSHHQSLHYWLV